MFVATSPDAYHVRFTMGYNVTDTGNLGDITSLETGRIDRWVPRPYRIENDVALQWE